MCREIACRGFNQRGFEIIEKEMRLQELGNWTHRRGAAIEGTSRQARPILKQSRTRNDGNGGKEADIGYIGPTGRSNYPHSPGFIGLE